jgi:hypothetical protein
MRPGAELRPAVRPVQELANRELFTDDLDPWTGDGAYGPKS